jgi:hypothetical protein
MFFMGLVIVRPRWAMAAPERPATCLPSNCFCERPRDEPFRQPSNTWSNVAYVAVGGVLLGAGSVEAIAFGVLCVLLGIGSAWFHATLTFRGEWLDVWSMYVLMGFLIARRLRHAALIGVTGQLIVFGALSSLGTWIETYIPGRVYPFASYVVLFAGISAATWRTTPFDERRRFLGGLACFLSALTIWYLDRARLVCAPMSTWQGHAVWHALCAVSLGLLGWLSTTGRNTLFGHGTQVPRERAEVDS